MSISEKIVISVVDQFSSGFASVDKGVKNINNTLKKTNDYTKLTLNGLSAMGAVAASALGAAYAAASSWVGNVNDLSKKTGMATESASKLLGVAQSVGLSGEDMSGAMMKMSKSAETAYDTLTKAEAAGKGSTDVYTKWGIAIQGADGKMLSSEQILQNVIIKHRQMANGVQKSAMEMEIFGKSGGALNTFLNQTDAQLDKTTRTLEKAGLIIDQQTADQYKKFNEELNRTKLSFEGLAVSIGTKLLPQFADMSDGISEAVQKYTSMDDGTKTLIVDTLEVVAAIGGFAIGIKTAIYVVGPFIKTIGDLIVSLMELKQSYDLVAVSKSLAMGGGIALLGAGAAYGGIQIGKALSGDNGEGARKWNESMMFGEAGSQGYNQVAPYDPNKDDAEYAAEVPKLRADADALANKTKFLDDLSKQVGKLGTAAETAGDKVSNAADKAVKAEDNRVSWVENMRLLGEQNFPYQYSEYTGNPEDWGTNCALAISKAMEGTVYGGQIGAPFTSVDQLMDVARQLGQLHTAGTYEPKPGDIIVSNYSATTGHVGMVTEKGGVIQNGSHGGADGTGGIEEFGDINGSGTPQYIISSSDLLGKNSHAATLSTSKMMSDRMSAIKDVKQFTTDLAKEIRDMGTTSEVSRIMYEAQDKINQIKAEITKGKANGADTKELEAQAQKYLDAMKEKAVKAQREEDDQKYQYELDHISRMTDLDQGFASDMTKAYIPQLEAYKDFLNQQLELTTLTNEERAKLEQNLADTMTKIHEQESYSMNTAWDSALREMANRQINYNDSVTGIFDNLQQAGVTLLSSTENISTKAANFFQSIAENILETMAKIIMQGLITNTILSIFGMGGGGFSFSGAQTNTVSNAISGSSSGMLLSPSFGSYGRQGALNSVWSGSFASGGDFNPGYAVVGEQGRELVRFGSSGHVYTANETNNILGGGNKAPNMTVNIHNESGTPVKAEQGEVSFDGESYVLNVFLKAISSNKNNVRGILKGAVTTT